MKCIYFLRFALAALFAGGFVTAMVGAVYINLTMVIVGTVAESLVMGLILGEYFAGRRRRRRDKAMNQQQDNDIVLKL
jgi:membrane protein implicated in regulation of membrane protease activity